MTSTNPTPSPRSGEVASDADIAKRYALAEDLAENHQTESLREIARQDLRILNRLAQSEKALATANERVEELKASKDKGYEERQRLVVGLSKLFPSWLGKHPDNDPEWERDWMNIVYVELPTGQASWHIHDSQLPWFAHLKYNPDGKWDGHSDEVKYERVASLEAVSEGIEYLTAKLARYEGGAASARECIESLGIYRWGQMSESLQKQRIGRILAHTAKVVEPWKDMVERLVQHIGPYEDDPISPISWPKVCEDAKKLLADAEVTK